MLTWISYTNSYNLKQILDITLAIANLSKYKKLVLPDGLQTRVIKALIQYLSHNLIYNEDNPDHERNSVNMWFMIVLIVALQAIFSIQLLISTIPNIVILLNNIVPIYLLLLYLVNNEQLGILLKI